MAEPPYPTVTFPLTRIRGTYPTKDGYVAISALLRYTDVFFQLVGADIPSILEDWTENQSITSESYSLVVDWVKSMTTEEAMELFNKHNMPAAPINTFEMLKKEPQFTEREMLFEHSHPEGFSYHAIGNPIKLSESLFEIYRSPPTLGEHTSEILSSILGYSEEKIKDFRTKKVID